MGLASRMKTMDATPAAAPAYPSSYPPAGAPSPSAYPPPASAGGYPPAGGPQASSTAYPPPASAYPGSAGQPSPYGNQQPSPYPGGAAQPSPYGNNPFASPPSASTMQAPSYSQQSGKPPAWQPQQGSNWDPFASLSQPLYATPSGVRPPVGGPAPVMPNPFTQQAPGQPQQPYGAPPPSALGIPYGGGAGAGAPSPMGMGAPSPMGMGAPSPMGGPPGARYAQAIYQRITETIRSNGLSAFYPQQQLNAVMQVAQTVDFDALARRWRLPNVELALDLASLALYDVVLFCDDSGSMAFQEDGSRIDDLKAVVEKVAEVVTLFDDDGIVVRFFNSPVCGDGITTPAAVSQLVSQVKFAGSTPMGEKLYSSVLQPLVYSQRQLKKPVLVITVTDGVPDNQLTVTQAIQSCRDHMSRQPWGPKAVAFQFAQVGNDMAAMRWLATLDNHAGMGDVVDVTSNFEAEAMEWARKNPMTEMTPGMWLLKMMLGAIDPQYDDKD